MKINQAKIRPPSPELVKSTSGMSRPSTFTGSHRGEYYNIDIAKLVPFHRQARKYFDEKSLQEMAKTISEHGIRQPLTVIPDSSQPGMYEVISGERRLRAAKIAGLDRIPCIIIHDYKAASEIAIIENIQREDLHPLELAKAYEQLLEEKICSSHAEVAKKIGVSKSVVTETLGILKLPDQVKTILLSKNINNRDLFRELSKLKETSKMVTFLDKHYSVRSERTLSPSKKGRRKTLLKVIKDGDMISIDTNQISSISVNEKTRLRAEIELILK